MILFVSLSRATVENTLWYRFRGKRKVTVSNSQWDAEIWEGDKWGYLLKEDKFYILIEGDTRFVFEADAAQMRSLLSRSTPFRGKIDGTRVKSKTTPPKTTGTGKNVEVQDATPLDQAVNTAQDLDLLEEVRKAKIKGADGITFLSSNQMPDGSEYNYFDASSTFPDFDPKKTKTDAINEWQDKIDAAVIKATTGLAVGSSVMKYDSVKTPVLVIMREL